MKIDAIYFYTTEIKHLQILNGLKIRIIRKR